MSNLRLGSYHLNRKRQNEYQIEHGWPRQSSSKAPGEKDYAANEKEMIVGWSILMGLALLLNLNDRKMLALTLIVTAGFFSPVPSTTWQEFYMYCLITEACVFLAAFHVRCPERYAVMLCAGLLFLCHCMGYWKDGFPALSPYRLLVPSLEYAQIVCCIILSRPLKDWFINEQAVN